MEAEAVHPQAAAVLDRQRRLGVVPLHERGVRQLRLLNRVTDWFRNRNPPVVGDTTDRTIPGPAGDLPIRSYRPRGDGPFPTVVFFHGGGFVTGSLASHDLLCRHLTRESGCVVLAVDYRLAPEHPFPAAVEDAYRATEWAAANPGVVGGDGRLAVAGDSAGGTLAAVAALMAAERDGPAIDHQVLFYPGIGIEDGQASVESHAGKVLAREDLEWFRDCYFGSELHRRNPYADPVNACDLSGVPSATVITAGFDPLRDGGTAYAERLVGDGVPVRYDNYEDMIHGFVNMPGAIDRATEALSDAAAGLTDAFSS
ncbi:alpha/beta hydrolase [Halococcus agarilyticus]|uniref:alpha/beta hydrolase n=1 Tax=Halococcus agarilyticus TaxID=1232219 RepID=UPI00067782B9|nr:alpha/beta hydrolase [Halococcus agarilyticus]